MTIGIENETENKPNRSHKYFREKALNGDVVTQWSLAALMEVDTLLICTTSGHSTTKTARYRSDRNGGKKLADIVYDRNGDGTVQGMSATGSIDGFVKLRTCFFSADHGKLAKDPKVLDQISATETDLTYSMDKEGVIEINEFGVMHALAEGSVIVTGTTAYGVSGQFTVTVKDDTNYGVESIALPATVKVGLNNKITLDVAFNPVNATNKNIKWYVEDDSIIRLTPGDAQAEIIGTKLGSTKVTAVSEDGGHVAECIVTVTEKEVGPPETGAVSMVLTGAMLVVAGIAVNMGKRRKKH